MSEINKEQVKRIVMTKEGKMELEKKLQYLKTTRTAENAEQINVARGYGDLSENAEYEEAKNEQARLMAEIAELEDTLRFAEIVDEKTLTGDKINLGSVVKVLYIDDDEIEEYTITGARESTDDETKISNESPIGAALIGKVVGDIAEATTPNGIIRLKVLEAHR